MATIEALQSSWASLGRTLGSSCSGTTGSIGSACTGAIMKHARISGRAADWNKFPPISGSYDAAIAALDNARQQLGGGATSAALASANQAMGQVEALLDNA